MSARKHGIIQSVLSGLCFGALGPLGKSMFANGATPGELLSLRFILSAFLLWPILWIFYPQQWKLKPKQILACAALGVCGYALFSSLFFMSVQGLSASLAVLLLYTFPVMVAGFAWIFWGDKIPQEKWPALPLALAGLAFLVWGDLTIDKSAGIVFGLAAAVFYSIYILASSRLLRGAHFLVSTTYIITFAGIALGAMHLNSSARVLQLVTENVFALTALVLFCTVGAMSLFLASLQKLKPWEVSLLSTMEPVTGVLLATLFFNEEFTWSQSIGAAGVLGALALVSVPKKN